MSDGVSIFGCVCVWILSFCLMGEHPLDGNPSMDSFAQFGGPVLTGGAKGHQAKAIGLREGSTK